MQPEEHGLGLAGHVPSLPLIPRELDQAKLSVTVNTQLDFMRETGNTSTGFLAL